MTIRTRPDCSTEKSDIARKRMNPPGSAEFETDHHEQGACGGCPDTLCEGNENTNACQQEQDATIITKQEDFLHKIHEQFLEKVNPIESGLVDTLRGVEALSSEDEQSIENEKTRRNKARKFWNRLHRIPEEDFANSFVPKLKKVYPHVMPGLEFQLENSRKSHQCLRHAMRNRINLNRLIDILRSAQCCSQEKYLELTSNQYNGDKEWGEVFQMLQRQASNSQLCCAVKDYLLKRKIDHPERFRETAAGGFACTCQSSQPLAVSVDSEVKLDQMMCSWNINSDRNSSATYPSSPLSSKVDTDDSSRVDSGVGYSLEGALQQPALFAGIAQFQSLVDKKKYKEIENRINSALEMATSIRTDLRFLEKIRDDARSHAKQAKDETPSTATHEELQTLLHRGRENYSMVEQRVMEVGRMWESVQDLNACLSFSVPADWKSYLLIRHHLLRNEERECRHCSEKAKEIINEISFFCQQMPPTKEDG